MEDRTSNVIAKANAASLNVSTRVWFLPRYLKCGSRPTWFSFSNCRINDKFWFLAQCLVFSYYKISVSTKYQKLKYYEKSDVKNAISCNVGLDVTVFAQVPFLPPNGDNQKCIIRQYMSTVTYMEVSCLIWAHSFLTDCYNGKQFAESIPYHSTLYKSRW